MTVRSFTPAVGVTIPLSRYYHASVFCAPNLRVNGVVTFEDELKAKGQRPCRRCWEPTGYQYPKYPEGWEEAA